MAGEWIDKIIKEIGENDSNQSVSDWLSTGYLPLNKAISGKYDGGLPVGRIIEIYGSESSGKTLLATMAMIETQKRGGLAMFLDYEHSFMMERAKSLGLSSDKSQWIYKQPETAEKGFNDLAYVAKAIREADSSLYVTVVADSVASMVTEEEMAVSYDKSNMKTRLSLSSVLSSSLKKLAGVVSNSNITLLFLNQTRANPGVMFGSKEITAGGNALKFYASTRIKLRRGEKITSDGTKDGQVIGERVYGQVVKNKCSEPWREVIYDGSFTEGIDLVSSHIADLNSREAYGTSKGWLEYGGKKYRLAELIKECKAKPELYETMLTEFYKD